MKHCLPCNLDFPHDRRFCGSCGGSLSDSTTCEFCGDVVESKWKFCTGCGNTLRRAAPLEDSSTPASSVAAAIEPKRASETANASTPEWYAAPELFRDRDESTVESRRPNFVINPDRSRKYSSPVGPRENGGTPHSGKDVPTLSMLSTYGESEPVPRLRIPPRYPIVLSLALIALLVMVTFGGWYVWAHRASSSRAERATGEEPSAMGNQFASTVADETPAEHRTAENVDDVWKRLKQQRITASATDKDAIIAALEQAEKKYPNDYRFPYERAKLSITGVTSHHEAFAALASAAEKAIDNGKAQDMLDSLLADKDGDFWKPSHGHHEWHALLEALEHKDKSQLASLRHSIMT